MKLEIEQLESMDLWEECGLSNKKDILMEE
jgi:hypothetical protein